MSVSTIGSLNKNATGLGEGSEKRTAGSVARDDFLRLLITQLQNQDPLKPLESTEFTAQLAQFSSLEQLFDANARLEGIQERLGDTQAGQYLGYIGKTVQANADTLHVGNGKVSPASYRINEKTDVTIRIFDETGTAVRTLSAGQKEAGIHAVQWDGRDDSANLVRDGDYSMEVWVTDSAGRKSRADHFVTGEVTGVTYRYGVPYLLLGDQAVTASSVIEVQQTAATNRKDDETTTITTVAQQ